MLAFLPLRTASLPETRLNLNSYRKEVCMCWIWLFMAILLEVAATVFMKLSNGFSKLVPTLIMALLYGISFFPLAIALKKMDVSTVYAVWSAVGTALVTMIGMFLFKESMSGLKVFAIVLIVAGVVTLNLTERSKPAPGQTTAELTHSGTKDVRSQ
jgi:small multidrug resistance pump